MSFIDGLGKGQMISRQGLASPYLGDIQLSLCDRRGNLEVEVIRARNLQAKTNKILPRKYRLHHHHNCHRHQYEVSSFYDNNCGSNKKKKFPQLHH